MLKQGLGERNCHSELAVLYQDTREECERRIWIAPGRGRVDRPFGLGTRRGAIQSPPFLKGERKICRGRGILNNGSNVVDWMRWAGCASKGQKPMAVPC